MPTFLRKSTPWFILIALWYLTLLFLSSQSNLNPPGPKFFFKDKVAHAAYFAIGGSLLYFALHFARPLWSKSRICLIVILFCATIGALDEFRQSFVPNRQGNDLGDWIADITGGIIACLFAPLVLKKFFRR